jgi:hypothetical protein
MTAIDWNGIGVAPTIAITIDWSFGGVAVYMPPEVNGSALGDLPRMVYAGEADSDGGKVAGSPRGVYMGDADS